MAWNEAIEFVRTIEAKFGGWAKVMTAWANGWIERELFFRYVEAQKIIREGTW